MLEKQCSKCKEWKDLECFYKDKRGKYGRVSHCRECKIKYNQEHKEEKNQYSRKYYQNHKKEIIEAKREYREKYKDEIAQRRKERRKKATQYEKIRRKTDPYFRLNCLMSKAIAKTRNGSIKQGRSWKQLLPYTLIELKKHLKSTLPEGYAWEDFLQGRLHIDHILPKVIFQYEKPEDLGFQICWGLDNLRLLPAKENLRKNSKLIKSFQKHFDIEVKIKK